MQDVWKIHDAPLWLTQAFLSSTIGGLLAQSQEGILSILYAMDPDRHLWEVNRLLPGEQIRISTATFAIDRERQELRFLRESEATQ